jgi:phosphate starvation-inducible PhoH-like protein
MKMFLTRLGFNSQMVITGDLTQIDLAKASDSGLAEAVKLFGNIKGISLISFDKNDVMRHPLVSKIINQYEKNKRE